MFINSQIPSTSGVYCLWNKITNQIYVGSSVNLQERIKKHFSTQCHNPYLKRSIKKYGRKNFSISWFETNDFIAEEQKLLDYIFASNLKTFNIAVKAGGGRVLSNYSKHKQLSESGGGFKAVSLFLIDTKTKVLTRIESSCEGERKGFGSFKSLSSFSKSNCLKRVKTCLVAKSEKEAIEKLEDWLKIPGNKSINNPIVLKLPEGAEQSQLYKLANVNPSNFSKMYRQVLNPSSREPRYSSMQSKADFNWFGTEVKTGDWFRCTKARASKL